MDIEKLIMKMSDEDFEKFKYSAGTSVCPWCGGTENHLPEEQCPCEPTEEDYEELTRMYLGKEKGDEK